IFIFKLQAWLSILSAGEIVSGLFYGLALNLLESLAILFVLMALCCVLPAGWFKDAFVARGTWLVSFVLGSILVYFQVYASLSEGFMPTIYLWSIATLALAIPVGFFGGRIPLLRNVAIAIADRFIVLLLIFIPASLLSLFVIIYRNIF
ncbi:MAG: hypothetical protein Q7J80_17365, partial [Anaerolineales bacterium]|nr:hypothetical protein [Anaerolineales bacterium]